MNHPQYGSEQQLAQQHTQWQQNSLAEWHRQRDLMQHANMHSGLYPQMGNMGSYPGNPYSQMPPPTPTVPSCCYQPELEDATGLSIAGENTQLLLTKRIAMLEAEVARAKLLATPSDDQSELSLNLPPDPKTNASPCKKFS
jgi:hypothetical protein